MPRKKLTDHKDVVETYDVRIEGQKWVRGVSCAEAFAAIQAAFDKLDDPNEELLFLIQENFTGSDQTNSFCTNEMMWEAICENPAAMRMYLQMGWEEQFLGK